MTPIKRNVFLNYYVRLCGVTCLADVEPIVLMEPDLYTATEPA